jgi:hypothetical protein
LKERYEIELLNSDTAYIENISRASLPEFAIWDETYNGTGRQY